MRVTVDLPEESVRRLVEITGESDESVAVAHAVRQFVRQTQASEFTRRLCRGEFDYPVTNDELEALDGPLPAEPH